MVLKQFHICSSPPLLTNLSLLTFEILQSSGISIAYPLIVKSYRRTNLHVLQTEKPTRLTDGQTYTYYIHTNLHVLCPRPIRAIVLYFVPYIVQVPSLFVLVLTLFCSVYRYPHNVLYNR